jgi:sugar phosphate isomerase/epimerase
MRVEAARLSMERVGYSTYGFADRDLDAALDAIAAAGFAKVEILGQDPHLAVVPTGQALADFAGALQGRGLVGGTVHAPLRRNVLGAPDEDWRCAQMGVMRDYLRFTAAIGFTAMIVHPVPNPIFVPRPDDPDLPRRIGGAVRRSLDELVPVAQSVQVRLLLENLPYQCGYPFLTMDELRPLVDGYPAAALGLVVDTGHAWTKRRDPAAEIRVAGPRLWGTHLQDVDYEHPDDNHWVPTHGGLDWQAICGALAEVRYAGQWTFEINGVGGRHGESPEELARITRALAAEWAAA